MKHTYKIRKELNGILLMVKYADVTAKDFVMVLSMRLIWQVWALYLVQDSIAGLSDYLSEDLPIKDFSNVGVKSNRRLYTLQYTLKT